MENRDPEYGEPRMWELGVVPFSQKKETSAKTPVGIQVNEISWCLPRVLCTATKSKWNDHPGPVPFENAGTPYLHEGLLKKYLDRLLQPRDWANFCKVMVPKE